MPRRHMTIGSTTLLVAALCLGVAPTEAQAATLPSVFCDFDEQFIVISREGVLIEDHENGAKFTRYQPKSVKGSISSTLTITLPKASGVPALVLTKQEGLRRSHSAEINVDRTGECTAYPSGFVLRKVTGVASDDSLNIRADADASADVLETLRNGNLIWVKPSKSQWLQVTFVDTPDEPSGDEPEVIGVGWVRSSFVTKTIPKVAHD
jgi:hypothetical protein